MIIDINNIWNNFKLKMKEKRTSTGNLLHFLLLYHSIALLLWYYCGFITIWYYGVIFHDLSNDCLEVYHNSWLPASSTPKGNRRFGVLLLTKFSLKHKANQVLPATTEKIKFCLLNYIASYSFRLYITPGFM